MLKSNFKNVYAFSVAEALVALLIGSLILGASAPMISKQLKHNNFTDVQASIINKKVEVVEKERTKNTNDISKMKGDIGDINDALDDYGIEVKKSIKNIESLAESLDSKVSTTELASEIKKLKKELESKFIPAGSIMFFDLAVCPSGWTALNTGGAFIRDVGGEADARGVVQEGGVPNLVGFNGMSALGEVDGRLFTISSKLGSKSHEGGAWEVGADFNASGYSDVYKDGLNEVRPKNIAYLACKKN